MIWIGKADHKTKGRNKMNKTSQERLKNNTVGTISDDTINGQNINDFIGENVTVHLHDENGHDIEDHGKLEEILEIV